MYHSSCFSAGIPKCTGRGDDVFEARSFHELHVRVHPSLICVTRLIPWTSLHIYIYIYIYISLLASACKNALRMSMKAGFVPCSLLPSLYPNAAVAAEPNDIFYFSSGAWPRRGPPSSIEELVCSCLLCRPQLLYLYIITLL